ncbi:congested-like trachea protein [Atheta coriaria]|uniref:congested-like trachea protein n=1 Tax=Dalotia coriaria TaxID=877792 RepID=UPI0031F43218
MSKLTLDQIAGTPLEYFICGGIGGCLATFVGYPFDTIKVRTQTLPAIDNKLPTPGIVMKNLIKKEGILGLYRGILAPLATIIPNYGMSFCTYKVCKIFIGPREHELLETQDYFISGCTSGFFTSFIQAPADRVKVLLQIQRLHSHKEDALSAKEVIKKLYKDGGLKNIYKGIGATLLKEIPANGAYFATYETLRDGMTNRGREATTPRVAMIAGGTAGLTYAILVAPLDVLKNRVQAAKWDAYPRGVRDVLPELYKTEGLRGFTRGLTPVLLRAVPANVACFFGFEMARQHIRGQCWLMECLWTK